MGILRALQYRDPHAPPAYVNQADFERLAERVRQLESRVKFLEGRPMGDKAKAPWSWGDATGGDPYYHQHDRTGPVGDYNDLAGVLASARPWVSTTARFAESLTSPQFVKATFGQAALLSVTFSGLGVVAAVLGHLPWYSAPAVGLFGFALSAGILTIHNRGLLIRLTRAQADKGQRRRQELRVQLDRAGDHGADFLYLQSNITEAQLFEFAAAVCRGKSLALHAWVGGGSLFSRGQYDDLMAELELMRYVTPGRGNLPRTLTSKGKALMRALAEKAGK